jgi:DNA-binding winged helix-turn-helix (wHTH) protein/TolB-like protein
VRAGGDARERFGAFEFDPVSGILHERGVDGVVAERRLAPQPAALLALLLRKRGELTTREEIRERLWPDVNVDFEASLHHCVRQLRVALDESAKHPRFLETVPRRGYRFHGDPPGGPATTPTPTRRRAWVLAIAAIVLVGGGAAWIAASRTARTRLAIMPFASDDMPVAMATSADVACEHVLVDVTHALGDTADVLGPRTTGPARGGGDSLPEIAAQLDATHVLNARAMADGGSWEILVELIRVDDGRHVWVQRFSMLDAVAVDTIVRGVVAELAS